jgi:tight adherence protein C
MTLSNPSVLLVLGGLLVFAALALVFVVIGTATKQRQATARSLQAIRSMDRSPDVVRRELDRPFSERVIAPLGERLVGIGRQLTRADAEAKIQHRLDIAGNPTGWDVNRIIGLKVLGLAIGAVASVLWCLTSGKSLSVTLVVSLAVAVFGYLLPNILLNNAGEKREQEMQNALPDALDLMTISVEAGLGFDAAVSRVAKETTGPLAQELARLLQEMQIGVGGIEAMRAMAERTTMHDLKSFCLAMVQADTFGIPVARVLRVQSKEMRGKRRQRAEEKAQQVPVKILFPLIFFILPSFFVVTIGPVVLETMNVFGSQQ